MSTCRQCIIEECIPRAESYDPFAFFCESHWRKLFGTHPNYLELPLKVVPASVGDSMMLAPLGESGTKILAMTTDMQAPPIFLHKQWLAGGWKLNNLTEIPKPEIGELWQCRLKIHYTFTTSAVEVFLIATPLERITF